MFFYFAFILGLAAAAAAAATSSENLPKILSRTDRPRLWTMFATPPSNELHPSYDTATPISIPEWIGTEPKGPGERVVVGYEPVYGWLNYNLTNDVARLPQDWDFKCPKRYGYYRYERSCDLYIECKKYQPKVKVCPDGMHFKETAPWSEYPCAYPPEAQCLSRLGGELTALPARPTAECPHQFGNYPIFDQRYSNYDRCSSYISCSSGVAHVMNCTLGLVFNPKINLCDWPEQVPGCHDIFEFRCPVPHLGEEDMVINYRYTRDPDCRYFYSCLNGGYRLLACDEGLVFNYQIGRCVEYDTFTCEFDLPLPSIILPGEEPLLIN